MNLLKDKNAVITGAARGIGKAIALSFAKEGANIAVIDIIYNDTLKQTIEELSKYETKCIGYGTDVTNPTEVAKTIENIHNDFGSIDILVNNAGITRDKLLLRMNENDWDDVIKVNLKSLYIMSKEVVPLMIRQRNGSVINISSVVGVSGNAGQANYSASKAGIIGFTKSMAKEVGSKNIRFNAIAPGFIDTAMTQNLPENIIKQYTQMIPLRRMGTPEDIAKTAIFLASDMSSYITGQVIQVCGGMLT